jgi:hypothetical protein
MHLTLLLMVESGSCWPVRCWKSRKRDCSSKPEFLRQ